MPTPQPFRTQTTFVDNVLSVDVRYHEGRTRTLDTVRHQQASWGLYLPRPLQPGHTSREWLLSENHYDGRILLYTVVDWDDENPADYLAPDGGSSIRPAHPITPSNPPRAASLSMARNSTPPDRPTSP